MRTFRDAVVVVTGAGSGIGRATGAAFAKAGARVHLVDRDVARLTEVVEILSRDGGQVTAHGADCRDAEAMAALAEAVIRTEGRLDVLHNNAGVGHGGAVQETSLADWQWVLESNLWSVIHGIHAFVPHLISQRSGHVVNTASMAGLVGLPKMAPYCASKFAVVGLSEALAAELAPYGIHVTAICPGLVRTAIVQDGRIGTGPDHRRAVEAYYERQGAGPDQVAQDVLKAVRHARTLQVSVPTIRPLWLLKRLSAGWYQRVIRRIGPALLEEVGLK